MVLDQLQRRTGDLGQRRGGRAADNRIGVFWVSSPKSHQYDDVVLNKFTWGRKLPVNPNEKKERPLK